MFKRILVPLDGSTRAESALPVAARLARAYGGSLTLLQVVETTTQHGAYLEPLIEDEKVESTTYLEKVAKSAELAGVETEFKVLVGAVASTIIQEAQASHANLIVMCSHGYTGFRRWALGSVAQKLARHSPVPLLILREGDTLSTLSEEKPVRALVPLDGSPFSEAVFEPAVYLVFGLAYSLVQSGEVHLLRVIDLPLTSGRMRSQANLDPHMQEQVKEEAQTYLSKLIARLDEGGLEELNIVATASVETDPDVAEAIVREAEGAGADKYDLIAMATHGRGGLGHFVTGSVTERVLHTTKLPLLVVRPSQTEAASQEEAAEKEMMVVESMEIEMQM